ncbi:hypothetical protein CANTEDRAFT_111556 [Yamadazyma tenuis ATCC 10573]|uniref:Zn(2)-C6 fungal-type domain-containing protein n=2 Tax=Candida tenuis TaxID=2315449 RepID=G3BE47_CANTC|nr:uncharacterized protein CANTEDRAFT_111556 [Yamadazyma tenuis ATCC 10573]EGV60455.1 hypothetical protein CANTEDRAFT_111556 [Yamadazyma tenuis ATCC 10573]
MIAEEIAGDSERGETDKNGKQKKRTNMACIRCRTRHVRCPGGDPCKKCQLAKTKCEYVEADKKIVVSMKYLSKLHDDIARLKKENATLRTNLKNEELRRTGENGSRIGNSFEYHTKTPHNQLLFNEVTSSAFNTGEIIQPSLDKYGRLIQSRTGERIYVGSSSMTLFGLEIQNMVPAAYSPSNNGNAANSPLSTMSESGAGADKREAEVMEKEGNAYKITLAKTNTRPGLSINFTLPSYSYAMLLVDNFINYNDGCFYFFNEGLVKRFLMNLYSGNTEENKKIMRRNLNLTKRYDADENSIKNDRDDDTILETMWFCKILLIFATGEMYLGTESDVHIKTAKHQYKAENKKQKKEANTNRTFPKNTLPGSGYFYQASELFTGLFASGAIDNITKDGGIEVMLLYAFFLQVADCTIASYFYFGLALRSALILGWHVDSEQNTLDRFELEHRRRLWWTVYMYERMLSSKAGLPLSFSDDSVSTELPKDIDMSLVDFPADDSDVRGYYIFPSAEYINNCVTITQINAIILSCLYTKQPTINILPVVSDLVHRLMNWKNSLPEFLKIDFQSEDLKISRLIVNLMTEYFQGINLAVRPLLFHFASKKLKELQTQNNVNKYVDLSRYSKNVITLLNASFQASINTVRSIWALLPDNMVALFGWMDREYLFTSALTLILFNSSFGLHDATKEHLDHALTVFTKMKKLGNYPAAVRRAQLLKLISILDFNRVMRDLLTKHDDEGLFSTSVSPNDPEMPVEPPTLNMTNHEKTDQHQSNDSIGQNELNINNELEPLISIKFDAYDMNELETLYPKNEAEGIEGFTEFNEEQKLWHEITNDAVWLQHAPNKPASSATPGNEFNESSDDGEEMTEVLEAFDSKVTQDTPGYGDMLNHEFHDLMHG